MKIVYLCENARVIQYNLSKVAEVWNFTISGDCGALWYQQLTSWLGWETSRLYGDIKEVSVIWLFFFVRLKDRINL